MKEYTFKVEYRRNPDNIKEIDTVLSGKKSMYREEYIIRANRLWTALQRLGYQMCIKLGAPGEENVRSIRISNVKELPVKICVVCGEKNRNYG